MPLTNWKSFFSDLANKYDNPAPTSPGSGTSPAPSNGSTTTVQATADAVGTDTYAKIDTSISANDKPAVTITQGEISATAAAQSTQAAPAYASTSADVSLPNADLIFYARNESAATGGSDNATWATSSTSVSFLAIDFKFLDFGAPKVWTKSSTETAPDLLISGNLAAFNTNVSASGNNTLTSVEQSSLVVEDRFSTVSVSATAAVDDSPPMFGSFFNFFF